MPPLAKTTSEQLTEACREYWWVYYQSMRELHLRLGRSLDEPLKDRNQATTDSRHVAVFERFWRTALAHKLNVKPNEVGPRIVRFRPHRSKSYDVCWPLEGEPKILISIKTMQNAYRNFTNRIEEAFGDSAVLRLYRLPAAFGFFFFMLDGKVARGIAEQGKQHPAEESSGKGKGIAPFLELVEQGGDFFRLAKVKAYRREAIAKRRQGVRQNAVTLAAQSLLDLAASEPTKEGAIHYDSLLFAPTTIERLRPTPKSAADWVCRLSTVDERLSVDTFLDKLVAVARLRGLIR